MKATPGTRWSTVRAGDTLRIVALRELGDGMRWIEVANLNALRPPYITASTEPADRARGTLIWGDRILVPTGGATSGISLDEDLYGTDLDLSDGLISTDGSGDWLLSTGGDNLEAALCRRVRTRTGEVLAHPQYGCDVSGILGFKLREIALVMATGYVRKSVLADPRVESILRTQVSGRADTLSVALSAKVVRNNQPLDLNFVFPLER